MENEEAVKLAICAVLDADLGSPSPIHYVIVYFRSK